MKRSVLIARVSEWRKPALFVWVLALFAVGFFSQWPVRDSSGTVESSSFLADVYGPNVISQRFVAPTDNLSRIDLWLRNPVHARWVSVAVSLPDTGTIYEGRIPLENVREPTRYAIAFAPVKHSAGQTVELRLFAPELSESQSPAVLFDAQAASTDGMEDLMLNGRPVSGRMLTVLYARPTSYHTLAQAMRAATEPWREKAALAGRRMSQYKPDLLKGRSLAALVALDFALMAVFVAYAFHRLRGDPPRWSVSLMGKNLGLVVLVAALALLLVTGVRQNRWLPRAVKLETEHAVTALPAGHPVVYDLGAMLGDANAQVATPPGNPDYVAARWSAAPGGQEPVLWMHPPSKVSYPLTVPPGGLLTFGVALFPEVWDKDGDGVEFQIVLDSAQGSEQLFWHVSDPKHNPDDRRWFEGQIDLGAYAGQEVTLTLLTYPRSNNSWDWAGWRHPVIVGRSP
jgi:hypothetical protein